MKIAVDILDISIAIDERGVYAIAKSKRTQQVISAGGYPLTDVPEDCLQQILNDACQ